MRSQIQVGKKPSRPLKNKAQICMAFEHLSSSLMKTRHRMTCVPFRILQKRKKKYRRRLKTVVTCFVTATADAQLQRWPKTEIPFSSSALLASTSLLREAASGEQFCRHTVATQLLCYGFCHRVHPFLLTNQSSKRRDVGQGSSSTSSKQASKQATSKQAQASI